MPFAELHYWSPALQMQTAASIILPNPELPGPYDVMFLLHGLSDDHTIWSRRTSIERYVDGLPLVVVMPDGGRGFYIDAPEGFAYESAMMDAASLISRYLPVKERWCATGLSMGGYGALRLALKRPERFASAHSHSGALRFGAGMAGREGKDAPAEFVRILGSGEPNPDNNLFELAQRAPKDQRPKIRFDCGSDDFLIEDNRLFHGLLNGIGYEHEYAEYPGSHTWEYWDEHVQEAIAFHRKNLGF